MITSALNKPGAHNNGSFNGKETKNIKFKHRKSFYK